MNIFDKDNLAAMLDYCKGAGKPFIFLALAEDVKDKKEFVDKTVPSIQGSMRNKLASHFTYVYYADVIEENDKLRYIFRTHKTIECRNVECKTPPDLHEGPIIDNDVSIILHDLDKFYED